MIKFIYPHFLLALLLLLIPLIIHFFHFKRYKTVYFSQVGFLKAVQQDRRKKNDLKKLLILISRLLLLACLVIAFARPYLPTAGQDIKKDAQTVAIFIDNSFSMNRMGNSGTLLEEAKSRAIEIANAYNIGTKFFLLTNDMNEINLAPLNKQELFQQVSKISESPKSMDLSQPISLLKQSLANNTNDLGQTIYFLSDFQEHVLPKNPIKADSSANYFFVKFTGNTNNNLLIDSCWFETPGRRSGELETLSVMVRNQSKQSVQNQPIRLMINDSLKAISDLTLEPDEKKVIQLSYRNNPSGFHRGKVELDDYPVVYDNSYFFSYRAQSEINVLLIKAPNDKNVKQLELLLGNDQSLNLQTRDINKVVPYEIESSNLAILMNINELGSGLSKTLHNFISKGGTALLIPGEKINRNEFNTFYKECGANPIVGMDTSSVKMGSINYHHTLFSNVFESKQQNLKLPVVKQSYRFAQTAVSQEPIIKLENGETAISDYRVGKGHLYNFNFSLTGENSKFMQEALFVALVYNIGINSLEPQSISYVIEDNMIEEVKKAHNDIHPFKISEPGNEESFSVPVINENTNYARLDFSQLINKSGFYKLTSNEKVLAYPAFNYNRKESAANYLTTEQLKENIQLKGAHQVEILESGLSSGFGEQIVQLNEGIELWYIFVLFSLLMIIMESAIIRWMK